MAVNSWQWLGLQIGNVCVILNNVIYDTWDFSPLVELGSKEQNPVNFRNMHKTKKRRLGSALFSSGGRT